MKTSRHFLWTLSVICLLWGSMGRADEKALAGQVLKDTGIKKGVCVILGAQSSELAMGLSKQSEFLIQILEPDPGKIIKARETITARGLYGSRLSVLQNTFEKLPYPEHFVNLIVITDSNLGGLSASEIRRVLRPKSIAWVKGSALRQAFTSEKGVTIEEKGGALLVTKLRPDGMRNWGHRMCNASGNPVSEDQFAGPPYRTQWIAGPVTNEGGHYGGVGLSANGRVFYFSYKHGIRNKVGKFSHHVIYARDAFNGLLLWQRMIPIEKGTNIGREGIVIATGDYLFQIGVGKGCLVIDAATGKDKTRLEPESSWGKILIADGILFGSVTNKRESRICAFEVLSGKKLWDLKAGASQMQAGEGKLFVTLGSQGVAALDPKTGKELWKNSEQGKGPFGRMIYHGGRLFLLPHQGRGDRLVLSVKDGSLLWQSPRPLSGRGGCLMMNDNIILGLFAERYGGWHRGVILQDQSTGKILKKITGGLGQSGRCVMTTGLRDWIFSSGGIFAVNLQTHEQFRYSALRTGCHAGFVHANGLSYSFPNDCFCGHSIKGIAAMAPAGEWKPQPDQEAPEKRLTEGPAYGKTPASDTGFPDLKIDWPTFKHDNQNSATTSNPISLPDTKPLWTTDTDGGIPTPPVVGRGRVFIGTSNHQLHCFDAGSGKRQWTHTAEGKIRYAPSLYQDLVLFGSDAGSVTCLEAAGGKLVWHFQPAPEKRWITFYDELFSTWAITTQVLIDQDRAYFCAGRVGWDGVYTYALEPRTGKVVWQKIHSGIRKEKPSKMPSDTAAEKWSPGRKSNFEKYWKDSEGEKVHVSPTVSIRTFSPYGALAATEKHILVPTGFGKVYGFSKETGELNVSSGQGNRIVVASDSWFFGGADPGGTSQKTKWSRGGGYNPYPLSTSTTGYRSFKSYSAKPVVETGDLDLKEPPPAKAGHALSFFRLAYCGPMAYANKELYGSVWRDSSSDITGSHLVKEEGRKKTFKLDWFQNAPMIARALVVAGETIFCSGDKSDEKGNSLNEGLVWALGKKDGKKLGEWSLPGGVVTDGAAAASGRIYIATRDGKVVCLGK